MEDQLALEQRVWQRVRGQRSPEKDLEETMETLIRLSREQVAGLKYGSRELYRREAETMALLNGLYHLRFGRHLPGRPAFRPGREECRRRAEEMLRLYIQLETNPEFGPLFTHLTRKQRAICTALEPDSARRGGS